MPRIDENQCPVCLVYFATERGRKSHQKQLNHYIKPTEEITEVVPLVNESEQREASPEASPRAIPAPLSAEERKKAKKARQKAKYIVKIIALEKSSVECCKAAKLRTKENLSQCPSYN